MLTSVLERKTRHEEIIGLYRTGTSQKEIIKRYKIQSEALRKILRAHKINERNCGRNLRLRMKEAEKAKKEYYKYLPAYGCYRGEFENAKRKLKYMGYDGDLANYYRQQKSNARVRGIPFNMSFTAWAEIWEASGHLNDRGIGKGKYVMARDGDVGAYTILNVEIIPATQNNMDAWKYKQWSTGRKKAN